MRIRLQDYSSRAACLEARSIIRHHFGALERQIPQARWVQWRDRHNWRFVEQLPGQLLIQKLARQITGVQTLDLLLLSGHLQEIGVLFRTLDEIHEDVCFIALGVTTGSWTPHHDDYARYFWSDDEKNRQPPVPRKTVRAYVNRALGQPDPSTADAVGREIHKAFSDYTHARSGPIMGMVHGPPPRFDLDGIHDVGARQPYVDQTPMYFYRCLVSTFMTTNVIDPESRGGLYAEIKEFEHRHADLLF